MDKSDFRAMFVRVDAPIADTLVQAVENLAEDSPEEPRETAGLICHRLRGDARSVGFENFSELAWNMELLLRPRSGVNLSASDLTFLRAAARELQRRLRAGTAACGEPLADTLKR